MPIINPAMATKSDLDAALTLAQKAFAASGGFVPTTYSTLALANLPTGGFLPTGVAAGDPAATVDRYPSYTINQTTAGQVLNLPVPTVPTTGHSPDFGYIAEEVAEILPALTPLDAEGVAVAVRYEKIVVLLVAELKKLRDRIAVLEAAT